MTLVWRPGYGGAAVSDPDAMAYLRLVEEADNQALEQGVQQAVNQFVIGCKADGIWSAIKASCILAGARTLDGALVPLVGAAPTRQGSEGGWTYNRKTGLKGSGSTGGANNYLRTGYFAASSTQNDNHIAFWKTTANAGGANPYYGGYSGLAIFAIGAGGNFNHGGLSIDDLTSAIGFHATARQASGSFTLKRPGFNLRTVTNSSTAAPSNTEVYIYNVNNGGSPGTQWFVEPLAFYSVGTGLDISLLDARVTTLINAIGAAIP